jgi:hypothetical protein
VVSRACRLRPRLDTMHRTTQWVRSDVSSQAACRPGDRDFLRPSDPWGTAGALSAAGSHPDDFHRALTHRAVPWPGHPHVAELVAG